MRLMPDEPYRYDAAIAARYDAAVPIEHNEIDFYLELARDAEAAGLRTLELACGTGRVAIPLAREGIRVLGIDVSPEMLARARAKSEGLDNVEWIEGDMRTFDLGEQFGFAYIPAGTFALLLTIEDQMSCLERLRSHLAPGARLAFDLGNFDIVDAARWLSERRGIYVRNPARDYTHPETGRKVMSYASSDYHPSEQVWMQYRMQDELDDDGTVVRREYGRPMAVRQFHRYEVEHLLARCGFEVEALYGDYTKSTYRGSSGQMVWVAKRSHG
jgi:SAM-dependent methyltransferase